jgi:hypothetical protein
VISNPPTGHSQLAIKLVDAPSTEVEEIWVNITRVTAHSPELGWITVSEDPVSVDLLTIQTQPMLLGVANLPPGNITQLRLYVTPKDNYVVVNGEKLPLKVPSGSQSGIKIKGPWQMNACERTEVTLDFDGKKSLKVHPKGNGQEWILRPVIKVKKSGMDLVGCGEEMPVCTQPSTCGMEGCGLENACVPKDVGVDCSDNSECLSGVCSEQCMPGGPGAPCHGTNGCMSGVCLEDGTCSSGDAAHPEAECEADYQCLSNACLGNACQLGAQGAPCLENIDCQSNICEGTCQVAADVN